LLKVSELETLLHLARSKVIYARRRLRVYHLANLSSRYGAAPRPPKYEQADEDGETE